MNESENGLDGTMLKNAGKILRKQVSILKKCYIELRRGRWAFTYETLSYKQCGAFYVTHSNKNVFADGV